MSTKYTEDQNRAIYEGNSNILVSAGAGSGKTAVLTERIFQKLVNGTKLEELVGQKEQSQNEITPQSKK